MIKDNWRSEYSSQVAVSNSQEFQIISMVHSIIAKSTFHFFESNQIEYLPVPSTTGSASSPMEPGSDSEPVIIKINDSTTLLTDSAQFHLEYGCRSFKKGCFYYGHSFRDEEPDWRHLSQFSHAEAEIPGTLNDVEFLVEQYVKYITKEIWKTLGDLLSDIPKIKDRVNLILDENFTFKKITFQEAYKLLEGNERFFKECEKGGYRISAEGEKKLLEMLGDFVWVELWNPMTVPFYQAYDQEKKVSLNADLLFGIGEVVGAGQRHITADELEFAINRHGLDVEQYKWYVDLKREYPMQTSGFGMGIERYLMWLLGFEDIRSVELFPRSRQQKGEV